MDGTINITILIGGRPYPLKIKEGDEPVLRKIVKEVEDKLNLYQSTYTRKDRQDWLAMTLLSYAVELHRAQITSEPTQQIGKRLSDLERTLAEALDEKIEHTLNPILLKP
jgi:cell division protein ZapA (FtsZ GTPase activity inhibitor)